MNVETIWAILTFITFLIGLISGFTIGGVWGYFKLAKEKNINLKKGG